MKDKKEKSHDKPVKLDSLKPMNPKPLGKKYKKDKENCGSRPGSATWAVWMVIKSVFKKGEVFTKDELAKNVLTVCKSAEPKKIKFDPDARLPHAIPHFLRQGVIAKTEKRGVYVKMVS